MKVFRGPKLGGELTNTDKKELSKSHPNLMPNDKIKAEISIDKRGERQSISIIELDENDFEHIHTNYLKFLKSKIAEQNSIIDNLSKQLEVHKKSWKSIENGIDNIYFVKDKQDDILQLIKSISVNQRVFNETEFNEVKFDIKPILFENILEDNIKRKPLIALKRLADLNTEFEDEFYQYCRTFYNKALLFYDIEYALYMRLNDPQTINRVIKPIEKIEEPILCSELISLIMQQICSEDNFL